MPRSSNTHTAPSNHDSTKTRIANRILWAAVGVGIAYLVYQLAQAEYHHMAALGFDYLGVWAFVFTVVCVLTSFRPKAKHRVVTLFALFVFYLGSYSTLSAFGDYHWSWSGRLRCSSGLSVTDVMHWSPYGVYGRNTPRVTARNRHAGPVSDTITHHC